MLLTLIKSSHGFSWLLESMQAPHLVLRDPQQYDPAHLRQEKGKCWLLSHVWLFATPWTVALFILFIGFSRQEHWSGLPFPSPEDEAQAGIKIAGKNINNLRYADDTTLMAEREEERKRLLMKVKEESKKVTLKLNIQKTKITASGPTTSWQIVGGNNGNSKRLHFGGYKITADGGCSHEIKRCLHLERKATANLDSILKSRDITLSTKALVKAMVFPVVMYGCESWTIKKAEHRRNDDFELWCWKRLLRVPWTARRSNQSALKEISPKY